MKELLLLSVFIEQYKLQFNCEDIPKSLDGLDTEQKIRILVDALNNNKKIEEEKKEDISNSI